MLHGCILRWFKTFAFNFGRHKCSPCRSNIEFFTESGYGQASIAYKSPWTISTTSHIPIFHRVSVRAPETTRAAFNTIKYRTIFDFGVKKQQHSHLLGMLILERNGQESNGILRLLPCVLNTLDIKEYIFLVPQARSHFFLPIYPLLLLVLFLVFWGLGLSGRIWSVITCMSENISANNTMFFQFRFSVLQTQKFLQTTCLFQIGCFFFVVLTFACDCVMNVHYNMCIKYSLNSNGIVNVLNRKKKYIIIGGMYNITI